MHNILRILYRYTNRYKLKEIKNELSEMNKKIDSTRNLSEHYMQASASLYNSIFQRISSIDKTLLGNETEVKRIGVGKAFTENKWKLIDKYYKEPNAMKCSICSTLISTEQAEKFQSEDIYGGGVLVRYRCPGCGAIVGPNKMLDLSEDELSEEYAFHYGVFDEGQTSEAEIETFMCLKPEKGKKYLNYGCGKWSSSIDKLRSEGYDILGFDAYASSESEFIINSFEELREMKFDGIISHDLLEHLRYPVETFELFNSLLQDGGIMVHGTACYKYVYEYDRFHLVFYTGNSVEKLCEMTGFELIDKIEKNEELQFNYVFRKTSNIEKGVSGSNSDSE